MHRKLAAIRAEQMQLSEAGSDPVPGFEYFKSMQRPPPGNRSLFLTRTLRQNGQLLPSINDNEKYYFTSSQLLPKKIFELENDGRFS